MKITDKLKTLLGIKSNLKNPIEELYKDYKELQKQLELVADRDNKEQMEWFRDNMQIYLKNWHTFRKSFE